MVPYGVARAFERAADLGFEQSCEPEVGRLLAVLAAGVSPGGRVLEIGTGAGVGTAWMVEGLGSTTDVELVTVDTDATLIERVDDTSWPSCVRFEVGDALKLLPRLGRFDLIFADAVAGKWYGLDLTIAALAPAGLVVVDDMSPRHWASQEQGHRTERVRAAILNDSRLVAVEIGWASGIILATRRVT